MSIESSEKLPLDDEEDDSVFTLKKKHSTDYLDDTGRAMTDPYEAYLNSKVNSVLGKGEKIRIA